MSSILHIFSFSKAPENITKERQHNQLHHNRIVGYMAIFHQVLIIAEGSL